MSNDWVADPQNWNRVPQETDSPVEVWRSYVPGGWLVAARMKKKGGSDAISVVFYPDAKHTWGSTVPTAEKKPLRSKMPGRRQSDYKKALT